MTSSHESDFELPDPDVLTTMHTIGPTLYVTINTSTISLLETPVIGEVLRKVVTSAPEGTKFVVVDLASVTLLNSMALGMLVSTYTSARNRGLELVLANVNDRAEAIFVGTRLDQLFTIYKTTADLEAGLRTR